jgi:superfamily II DNA or RNA helicase
MLVAPSRLALTATPPNDMSRLGRHVGEVVYELAVSELVGDALADYEHVMIPIELLPSERDRYRELRGAFRPVYKAWQLAAPGGHWKEFLRAAARTRDGRAAVAAWRASRDLLAYPSGKRAALLDLLGRHRDVRSLVFTANNATAYAIARELLVMPITHEIRRREREIALGRFRSGEAPVLVSSQVLDEGLDVPDAEVAIVVGGTASARRHVQRIGRVLRPRPGKRACVYELTVTATMETRQAHDRQRGLYEEHVS